MQFERRGVNEFPRRYFNSISLLQWKSEAFFFISEKEKIRKFNDNFAKRRKEIYKRNSVIVVSAMLMRDFILEE